MTDIVNNILQDADYPLEAVTPDDRNRAITEYKSLQKELTEKLKERDEDL